MKFTVALLGDEKPNDEFLAILSNDAYIAECIGTDKRLASIIPNYKVVTCSDNEANIRNDIIKQASSHHIIWLHTTMQIEEELFEEFEEYAQKGFSLVYPNVIINNQIKQSQNWYAHSLELLQTFEIEKHIPKFGIYTNTKIIDHYDTQMSDFSFYAFLYKNIKKISLTLSESSFIEFDDQENLDLSYKSAIIRQLPQWYDLKTELCPHLNWQNENVAYATSYTLIGNTLLDIGDNYNAATFYNRAYHFFANSESMKNLIYAYYLMGEFQEAKKLLDTYPLDEQNQKNLNLNIENAQKLISSLEDTIQQNPNQLIDFNELLQVYPGALMFNLEGVFHVFHNNLEKGYSALYNAAIRNPLNPDILHNLAGVAKILKKEEEIKQLYRRLLDPI